MTQLKLGIVPRLAYSARNFISHSGVQQALDGIMGVMQCDEFRICFVTGLPRSGKTHLMIKIAESLTDFGFFPRIVEGSELPVWISERVREASSDTGEVVLVDDADSYFREFAQNDSGPFVNLIETIRKARGAIIFFCSTNPEELSLDDHVLSRVRAGQGFCIDRPGDADVGALIEALAAQRGISLTERKVQFLSTRLGRDIAAIEDYFFRVSKLADATGSSIKLPLLSEAIEPQ